MITVSVTILGSTSLIHPSQSAGPAATQVRRGAQCKNSGQDITFVTGGLVGEHSYLSGPLSVEAVCCTCTACVSV